MVVWKGRAFRRAAKCFTVVHSETSAAALARREIRSSIVSDLPGRQ
jgi:hypothetical protein